jgi:hypothetical protein
MEGHSERGSPSMADKLSEMQKVHFSFAILLPIKN